MSSCHHIGRPFPSTGPSLVISGGRGGKISTRSYVVWVPIYLTFLRIFACTSGLLLHILKLNTCRVLKNAPAQIHRVWIVGCKCGAVIVTKVRVRHQHWLVINRRVV